MNFYLSADLHGNGNGVEGVFVVVAVLVGEVTIFSFKYIFIYMENCHAMIYRKLLVNVNLLWSTLV